MEIKDKVIIVTGASQGIGMETAKYLAKHGAKLALAARSADLLDNLAAKLPHAIAVKTDMRKPADVRNMIDQTLKTYGRIDILINNAGQGMWGPVEFIKIDEYHDVIDLNVYGVLRAMQAVIPQMRKQGGGMILNVSSGVTKTHLPMLAAYSSTKYALNAISLIARMELEKDKIIVSVIHPRATSSNFYKNLRNKGMSLEEIARRGTPIDTPEKVAGKIGELIRSEAAELII